MGTGSAVSPKKRGDTKPHKEKTKEIKQARGTPGRRRTQETQGNTTQSLRAALVHGGKGNKGPQKTPGHTSKAEEHKGAKATQDSKFPPTSCERPAAREQKAKGKHYQNPSPKPPQMAPKTSPNPPKKPLKMTPKWHPKGGSRKNNNFVPFFSSIWHPQGVPRRPKGLQKVTKNLSKTTLKNTSKKTSKNTSKKLPKSRQKVPFG